MKFMEISETTTSSGSISAVPVSSGKMQTRGQGVYPGKNKGKLLSGTRTNAKFPNSISEDELSEQDLILVPGQGKRLTSGLVPHGHSRIDHEVEMARSDLLQCVKNANNIFNLIKNLSEDDGLEGWVQEKIIKAADYLNTVSEYIEGKSFQNEMTGGVIAAGGVGEDLSRGRSGDSFKRDQHQAEWRREQELAKGSASQDTGNWYLRIDGRIFKDRATGKPAVFNGKKHANAVAIKMMQQSFNKGKRFILTTSPVDEPPEKNITERNFNKSEYDKRIGEGAKVDRMVKHIASSERKLGKSKDEAEDIAWATANKRGYLDNKNKKKNKG